MLGLSRWCTAHRRVVVAAWLALAISTTLVASLVGRQYATNFTLPHTEAQQARDLLKERFPTQSGDRDTIVWHTDATTATAPSVKRVIAPLLRDVATMPHVTGVVSPYSGRGALQVSRDGHTAFASIDYDHVANQLPDSTGKRLIAAVDAVHVPGMQIAAGGQVVAQAEGFSIGPATAIGVIAALVILMVTFGSFAAAGMPLVTAAFGLVTGIALIGLATHVTSMSNTAPELALMIGLGVGIDYALFIVTRFRELYARSGDIHASVISAMNTAGRAVTLAGVTVVIALLGMFATGVPFMYGMAVASVLAVLLVLAASLTALPALLGRFGPRLVRERHRHAGHAMVTGGGFWRRVGAIAERHPIPLLATSLAVMVAIALPVTALRLGNSDASNNATHLNTHRSFELLAQGFGPGFNGPLLIIARTGDQQRLISLRAAIAATPDVAAVSPPQVAPDGTVAVMQAYPQPAPQALATTRLVNRLRSDVVPHAGVGVLIGGFTAGGIDFAHVLAGKLPLFIGIVVVLSALLLLVIFRSLVIPLQAAVMNLLSIGGALGATVAVFQWGWLGGLFGVRAAPIEPWIPVLMFAVVFGLSMDYEVFLISRVREEWVHGGDARRAVTQGIATTGRVITAAAAIMVCVFLSFVIGDQRVIKEFGFGLAIAVFLDAIVVRCLLLPATLQLLGRATWRLPGALERRLPHFNIEGAAVRE